MDPLNRILIAILRRLPENLIKPVALRYIAGENLEDALRVVGNLNVRQMMATIDALGENVSTREESLQAVQACERALQAIREKNLDSNLSIKLSQFGVKIDDAFCRENVKRILRTARSCGNFVRIDMEDSSLTSRTLKLYGIMRGEGFENLGVVIQACLRRSETDVKTLIRNQVNVRVVKGIYVESETIALKDREEVRRNYLKLLQMLLKTGSYVGIATHDDFLVEGAYQYIREMNLPRTVYEFQMLYGVRAKLRDQIVADGHRMRIYIPFGKHWHSYSLRRFQENPQIARYVLQALLFRNH